MPICDRLRCIVPWNDRAVWSSLKKPSFRIVKESNVYCIFLLLFVCLFPKGFPMSSTSETGTQVWNPKGNVKILMNSTKARTGAKEKAVKDAGDVMQCVDI